MNINTQIVNVTVYQDQALVTRKGLAQLTGEEQELIISELPVTLEPNSVRVAGKGAVAVRLLAVRTELDFAIEPVEEKVRQLQM